MMQDTENQDCQISIKEGRTQVNYRRIKYPVITLHASELQEVSKTHTLDKSHERLIGFYLTANLPKKAYSRGTVSIIIDGREVLADIPAKALMVGTNVAMEDRWFPMDRPLQEKSIKLSFKDQTHPSELFESGYEVSLLIRTQLDKEV